MKGQFRYFEHWAPFLVCLGWNRPGLGYLAHFKSPLTASEWLVWAFTNLSLVKCATQRVVSGVHWCSKSSVVAKYSFCLFFYCTFIAFCKSHWFLLEDSLLVGRKRKGGLFTFGCSLFGSSPTVETENRANARIHKASHSEADRVILNKPKIWDRTNSQDFDVNHSSSS